jgi:hypothetical protein
VEKECIDIPVANPTQYNLSRQSFGIRRNFLGWSIITFVGPRILVTFVSARSAQHANAYRVVLLNQHTAPRSSAPLLNFTARCDKHLALRHSPLESYKILLMLLLLQHSFYCACRDIDIGESLPSHRTSVYKHYYLHIVDTDELDGAHYKRKEDP